MAKTREGRRSYDPPDNSLITVRVKVKGAAHAPKRIGADYVSAPCEVGDIIQIPAQFFNEKNFELADDDSTPKYEKMTAKDLRDLAEGAGLDSSGTKAELVARLEEARLAG